MSAGADPGAAPPAVDVRDATRTHGSGATAVHALRGVSLRVEPGELVALVGRSGSGKTTLLHAIGGLERLDGGSVHVHGTDVGALDERGLDRYRREVVAFVFQTFGLLPALTAAENVGIPLRLRQADAVARERRVAQLLDLVGLSAHAGQRPAEMSGGQQQRVAVARALAASPRLLVADEPTGQLDVETGLGVMALVRAAVEAEGMTAVVATHDPVMIALADRAVRLDDGRLSAA